MKITRNENEQTFSTEMNTRDWRQKIQLFSRHFESIFLGIIVLYWGNICVAQLPQTHITYGVHCTTHIYLGERIIQHVI